MELAPSTQNRSTPTTSHRRIPDPQLPSRVAPFDLGNGKEEITRALELNRQLLLASQQEPLVDEPAVRTKIDELLGRLLRLD